MDIAPKRFVSTVSCTCLTFHVRDGSINMSEQAAHGKVKVNFIKYSRQGFSVSIYNNSKACL